MSMVIGVREGYTICLIRIRVSLTDNLLFI